MNLTVKHLARAAKDRARRGIAAVEFALTLPIWVLLLLGMGDGSYYLLVNEKVDRIAYSVTDIVTQYQTITLADLADITLASEQLMKPFSFASGSGVVIVTSVFQPPTGDPVISWQYRYPGGSSSMSQIGSSTGTTATLPGGLTLNANDNVIISEVYYTFTPMFAGSGLFSARQIYRNAVYKPRLSPLVTPPT